MKNRVLSKALCIALASVLALGGAAPVKAATDTIGQPQAETAASTVVAAKVEYFRAGDSSIIESHYLNINANGAGKSAKLYINDVLYDTASVYNNSWYINTDFEGVAGVTYTLKLVVTGTDGKTITKTTKRKFSPYVIDKTNCSAYASKNYKDDGYTKYEGVRVYFPFKSYSQGYLQYDVYRSTNPKTGFKKISKDTANWGGAPAISYYDYTATYGKTYYYQVKLVARKDSYIKADKVLAVSPVMKVTVAPQNDYMGFWVSLGDAGVDISIYGSDMYNQFDIYRSATKNGGYTKIKTTVATTYTDRSVAAGKTYFYKIVPKYYDDVTNKLCSGPIMTCGDSNRGVKILMGSPYLKTDVMSSTSVKLSWDKVRGANVYEILYRNNNLEGDVYKKLVTTKATSYTVKGLKAGGTYSFVIKAQSVSGGKVLYENTADAYGVKLSYDGYIKDGRVTSVQVAASKDKKTVVIYTSMVWDSVIGASGYVLTALNNFTGKREVVAKFNSASRNRCKFRNPGSYAKGMKYRDLRVQSYRGSVISDRYMSFDVNVAPLASGIKVARKTNGTAVIRWNAIPGATGYNVYRKNLESGSSWSVYRGFVKANETAYEDKSFSVKTNYRYYVTPIFAVDGVYTTNDESYLDKKGYTYTYEHKLGAPKLSSVKNTAAKTVTVTWYNVTGAQAYYVYRATSKTGKYVKVGSVKGLSFVDKNAAKGKVYYYKVASVAVGGNGIKAQSGYSAPAGIRCTK